MGGGEGEGRSLHFLIAILLYVICGENNGQNCPFLNDYKTTLSFKRNITILNKNSIFLNEKKKKHILHIRKIDLSLYMKHLQKYNIFFVKKISIKLTDTNLERGDIYSYGKKKMFSI